MTVTTFPAVEVFRPSCGGSQSAHQAAAPRQGGCQVTSSLLSVPRRPSSIMAPLFSRTDFFFTNRRVPASPSLAPHSRFTNTTFFVSPFLVHLLAEYLKEFLEGIHLRQPVKAWFSKHVHSFCHALPRYSELQTGLPWTALLLLFLLMVQTVTKAKREYAYEVSCGYCPSLEHQTVSCLDFSNLTPLVQSCWGLPRVLLLLLWSRGLIGAEGNSC